VAGTIQRDRQRAKGCVPITIYFPTSAITQHKMCKGIFAGPGGGGGGGVRWKNTKKSANLSLNDRNQRAECKGCTRFRSLVSYFRNELYHREIIRVDE
jgi:hypothetical protein